MRSALLLGLLLAGCGLGRKPCSATEGGACSSDADCALAACTDSPCTCSCGVAVARSRLRVESPCLQLLGEAPASACRGAPVLCSPCQVDCVAARAVCRAGACATDRSFSDPDGGP